MESTVYAIFSALLMLSGLALVGLAMYRRRRIERSAGAEYVSTPMRVLDVNLLPLRMTGEPQSGPLAEKTSMVLVNYQYAFNNKTYSSRQVFPLDVEWMRPRVSAFLLFEDLKAGRLSSCFVDKDDPSSAVLFRGWAPYLKRHFQGVLGAGLLVSVLGALSLIYFIKNA